MTDVGLEDEGTTTELGPREAFLDIVLRTLFVLALITATPSMVLAVAQGRYLVAVVDVVALVALAVMRFDDDLSHRVRAWGIMGLAYAIGTLFLFELGWVSHVYLLAVPVIGALLLGLRPAVASLVLVAATMAVAGIGFDEGPYLTNESLLDRNDEVSTLGWMVVVANFTFIAASLSVSCAALFDRFERSLAENERSRRRLATVVHAVDQADEVVLVTDPAGSIVYANIALERLLAGFGETDEPEPIQSLHALALVTRDGRGLADLAVARAVWTGEMSHEGTAEETRTYVVSVAPVSLGDHTGAHSEAPNAVIVVRDVTDSRALEERLRQGEQFEALGMMAGGVAHDLKNIVAAISAVAESAEADASGSDDAPVRTKLTAIGAACRQAGEILRQLMSLGQRIAPEREPIRLSAAIDELDTLLRAVLGPSISLETRLDANDAVEMTPSEVNQLVTNLVINARDAIRPAAGRVWITLTADHLTPAEDPTGTSPGVSRAHLLLKVGDTGSGIAPEQIERVFDPFFTTKPRGEGTGLGLPSVHALVTSLGGTIDITSAVGHGTEITIRLPVSDEQPEPESQSALAGGAGAGVRADAAAFGPGRSDRNGDGATSGAGGGETDRPSGRIVMVDDEALLLSMCAGSLRRSGYQVETFGSGEEAVAYVGSESDVDLLITDLSLTDISGFEVMDSCRIVRPDLPTIIVSGSFLDAADMPELPAQVRTLEKPFTMAQLLDAVRRSLTRQSPGRGT